MPSPPALLPLLDACAADFTFPALDNGYVYPAAARLSLFRSPDDWALVIETFGYSPRAGSPATCVQTFASRLRDRAPASNYVTPAAYERYLSNHPHDEACFVYPFDDIDWDDEGRLAVGASEVLLRGHPRALPGPSAYARHGIALSALPRICVFEVCRYFAAIARDDVLATPLERRANVPLELTEILVLDDWHHPDIVGGKRPSDVASFRELARVLETGDVREYAASELPNTHWSRWPEGGAL